MANRRFTSPSGSGASGHDLAVMRTLMAADRTLMAWIRTSLSLLSFGFTIYKVLQALQESGRNLPHDATPQVAGMFLIAMGTLAIAMGTLEYGFTLRLLHQQEHLRRPRPPLIMAVLMSLTGMFLFVSIMTRIF